MKKNVVFMKLMKMFVLLKKEMKKINFSGVFKKNCQNKYFFIKIVLY
jgi:hypothetical protein